MHTITLDGPAMNALGSNMMRSLIAQLDEAAGQPVLITSRGQAFSAGLDLKEISSLDAAGMRAFLERFETLVDRLFLYPAPTGAIVRGHAIAGGAILALCCDLSVAPPDPAARVGLNEVALGLRFPPQLLKVIRYRLTPRDAERVLLGADLHTPDDAARLGLLSAVDDDPEAWISPRLAALARHPSAAYASTKLTLRAPIMSVSPEERSRFVDDILPAWTSPDLKAMIAALLNRKKP